MHKSLVRDQLPRAKGLATYGQGWFPGETWFYRWDHAWNFRLDRYESNPIHRTHSELEDELRRGQHG
jgi:hypothetical protein